METIDTTEARANFGRLLARVSQEGEGFVLARRGKPLAVLVPADHLETREARKARKARKDGDGQALQESQQRFRDFADAASDWFWEMDENCRFTFFSERFTEVTGVPRQALLGMTREETGIPDVTPEAWQEHLADLSAHRSFRDFRYPHPHPDGRVLHLSISGKAIHDERGKFKGYRGAGSEITDRGLAEERLRKTDALFKETERLAKLGHWEWDEIEDRCVYCSEELARMHGITVGEYLERASSSAADLVWVHPEDRERYSTFVLEASQRRDGFEIEYRLLQRPGEVLQVREVAEAVLDRQGRLIRSIGFIQDVSERKRVEQGLRESEERFRGVFELGLVGIATLTPAGFFLQVNRAYCKLVGYGEEELIGEHFSRVIHPDDLEGVSERLRQLLAGEVEGYRHDRRYRHKEGHEVWATAGLFALRNPDGSFRNYVVQVQDVTERKRAEAALERARDELERRVEERTRDLRESEQRFRDYAEASADWFWEMDANLRFTHMSGNVERIVGVAPEWHYGKTREDLLGDDYDRDAWSGHLDALREHKPFRNFEYLRVGDDIDPIWARTSGVPVFAKDGAFLGYRGTASDITERKQAELSLRESEERYREIFEESPVAIWKEDWSSIKQMLDDLARGGVEDWHGHFKDRRDHLETAYDLAKNIEISRAAIEIYRAASKDDLVQLSVSAFAIDEELSAFRDVVLSFLAGRMTVDFEAKDVAGDGSEIIVRRRVTVPPKYRDDWSRVIFAIEDVTDRARVEEQLRQAQKMEAVGQLTGGIAHDFNNLLAVILGNAEFLGDNLDEGQGDLLEPIVRAGKRGAELAQRLLAFSRKQTLRPRTIDLGELVGGMYTLLSRSLGERIEIEIRAAPGLWAITADPGQVESALLNLAINARDAMPDGGKLTIEYANAELDQGYVAQNPEAKAGDFLALTISDTGIGMSEEVTERALEPFFTTKDVGEGSGLGLSMIYGFIKQSGGHMKLQSEEGKGTTVRLYLPRAELLAEPGETREADQAPRGRGEVVLVVEDDPDVRKYVVRVLDSLGYRVIDAPDARSALAVLSAEGTVNLLLSDVVLSTGMSGWELARHARERHGDLKILLMSGYAARAANPNSELGPEEVLLNKPFKRLELAEKVRAALDR